MNRNTISKTLLCLAIVNVFMLAGCSSSNNDDTDGTMAGDTNGGTDDSGQSVTDGSIEDGSEGISDGSDATSISVENAESLLREIIKIANDEALDAASVSLEPVFNVVENLIDQAIINGMSSGNGLSFVSKEAISEGGEQSEYSFACDSGGTLVVRAYKDDSVGGPFIDRFVAANACSIDSAAYEGSADKAVRFVRGPDVSSFDNFSISYADGDSLLLHGDFSDSSPVGRGPVVEISWTDANVSVVEGGETTVIDAYSSYRRSAVKSGTVDNPGTTAMVSFTVTANWSSGLPLDVLVDLAYEDAEDSTADETGFYPAQWQTGTLRVTAADGSGLTLSPETGDSATFSVTIDGEADEPMIFNWADGFQVVCAPNFVCS